MKRLSFLFLFVALAFTACSNKNLSVNDVIKKSLEASGSNSQVKTMMFEANMSIMGMNMPMKYYVEKPGNMAVFMEAMGRKNQVVITANEGWTLSDSTLITLPPDQMKQMREQMATQYAFADNMLADYKNKGLKVEMAPKDSSSKDCYKLKVTSKDNVVSYLFVNNKTFLIDKIVINLMVQGQSTASEMLMKDYKKVNGVNIPHSIEMSMNGTNVGNIKLTKVEINAPIDPKIFAKPVGLTAISMEEANAKMQAEMAAKSKSNEDGPKD